MNKKEEFDDITVGALIKTEPSLRRGYKAHYFTLSAMPPKEWLNFVLLPVLSQATVVTGSEARPTHFEGQSIVILAESPEACRVPLENIQPKIHNANLLYRDWLKSKE